MSGFPDIGLLSLVFAVVALFAWFFWHTIMSMLAYARQLTDFLDTRSARLRERLEYEAIHGRPPLWYRTAQRLVIIMLVVAAAALVWTKFTGA